MNRAGVLMLILLGALVLSGCGETFRGVGRDASRVMYGVKTIFISQH